MCVGFMLGFFFFLFYYRRDCSKVTLLSSLFGFVWVCLFCSISLVGYRQPRLYSHLMLHSKFAVSCKGAVVFPRQMNKLA